MISDYDLIEAKTVIRMLQTALDRANARIRELETTCATMAERMADANERADLAEMHLDAMATPHDRAGPTQSHADISP